jgi:hypothetical protein
MKSINHPHRDGDAPLTEEEFPAFDINTQDPMFSAFTKTMENVRDAVSNDQPITARTYTIMRDVVGSLGVTLGTHTIALGELDRDSAIKRTFMSLMAIERGEFYTSEHVEDLLYLTDTVATILSKNAALEFCLTNLRALTDRQAEILAKAQCQLLLMSKLTKLTDHQVEVFSAFEHEIDLSGVRSITDAQAASFGNFRGTHLALGVSSITDAQTHSLAKFSGKVLCLNDLATLTPVQASAFAACNVEELYLKGISSLSKSAMDALMTFQGRGLYIGSKNVVTDGRSAFQHSFPEYTDPLTP